MLSRSRSLLAAVLLAASSFSLVASASDWEGIGKGNFKVNGSAKPKIGPKLKFDGKGGPGSVEGKQDGNNLVFTAKLGGLDMGERTEHAKKDFECGKHGTATLTVDKSKLKLPEDQKETSGSVPATFNYRGKDEPVTVTYKGKRTGSDFHVISASFSFDYTKHNMGEICRFGGTICVEKSVTVSVSGVKFREK